MKVGIMQPYFVPYIGYWQLMNAVDKYVVYDDVDYIKGGWINRNRILINGTPRYFNIPIVGASSFKKISEIGVNNDMRLIEKNLRTIEMAYSKAPYFSDVYPIIKKVLYCGKENLAEYILESFEVLCEFLNIKTELILSSKIDKDNSLRAQDKVIDICKVLGADEYYNAIGGQELYSYQEFEENNIKLSFLKTDDIKYKQFNDFFEKNLSIIDVMMFNSRENIKSLMNCFTLLSK